MITNKNNVTSDTNPNLKEKIISTIHDMLWLRKLPNQAENKEDEMGRHSKPYRKKEKQLNSQKKLNAQDDNNRNSAVSVSETEIAPRLTEEEEIKLVMELSKKEYEKSMLPNAGATANFKSESNSEKLNSDGSRTVREIRETFSSSNRTSDTNNNASIVQLRVSMLEAKNESSNVCPDRRMKQGTNSGTEALAEFPNKLRLTDEKDEARRRNSRFPANEGARSMDKQYCQQQPSKYRTNNEKTQNYHDRNNQNRHDKNFNTTKNNNFHNDKYHYFKDPQQSQNNSDSLLNHVSSMRIANKGDGSSIADNGPPSNNSVTEKLQISAKNCKVQNHHRTELYPKSNTSHMEDLQTVKNVSAKTICGSPSKYLHLQERYNNNHKESDCASKINIQHVDLLYDRLAIYDPSLYQLLVQKKQREMSQSAMSRMNDNFGNEENFFGAYNNRSETTATFSSQEQKRSSYEQESIENYDKDYDTCSDAELYVDALGFHDDQSTVRTKECLVKTNQFEDRDQDFGNGASYCPINNQHYQSPDNYVLSRLIAMQRVSGSHPMAGMEYIPSATSQPVPYHGSGASYTQMAVQGEFGYPFMMQNNEPNEFYGKSDASPALQWQRQTAGYPFSTMSNNMPCPPHSDELQQNNVYRSFKHGPMVTNHYGHPMLVNHPRHLNALNHDEHTKRAILNPPGHFNNSRNFPNSYPEKGRGRATFMNR